MHWGKRGIHRAALVFLVVAASIAVPAQNAAAGNDVSRVAGTDRFATAAALSAASFQPSPPYVFVATGVAFADALAGGAAAGATKSPVLLSETDRLPQPTKDELTRLRTRQVVVLGGSAAVSEKVVEELRPYSTDPVKRIAGTDRFATAAAISRATYPQGGVPVAYVASGTAFADALAGGPSAALKRGPLLLVAPDHVPGATRDELLRLKPQSIRVLGGSAVVADLVLDELRRYTSGGVSRISGRDRYATAATLSAVTFEPRAAVAIISTGLTFPDALGGGASGGAASAPLLLVPGTSIPQDVWNEIDRLQPQRILVLGGPNAVSQDVERQLREACGGGPCGEGPGYRFVHTDSQRRPAHWPPCDNIHYRLNTEHAPEGAAIDTQAAIRRVAEVTGLTFVFDGTTTMKPGELKTSDPSKPPSPELLIGWTRPGDPGHPQDSTHGDARVFWRSSSEGPLFYAATIAMDATRPLEPGFTRGDALGPLMLHELGHVVGLDHVERRDHLMFDTLRSSGPTDYAPGDVEGLKLLGPGSPC